jgi:hypothetical protein
MLLLLSKCLTSWEEGACFVELGTGTGTSMLPTRSTLVALLRGLLLRQFYQPLSTVVDRRCDAQYFRATYFWPF